MRFLTITLSLLCVVLTAEAAKADRRVAFVVGNGAYKTVTQLPNPPVDAKAMAATLRNVGFDVVEGTNLTRDKMTEKLLDFGRKAQGADIAVFYYAGHGIAIAGTNYLLPVDADLKSEIDVKLGSAINIDVTLDQTMGDAKVKLVFLDACRDNPFAAKIKSNSPTRSVSVQTGLAEMKSGEGTLIAFATGPGQTALDGDAGANSPFTRALISHIAQPGVEIQQAMTAVRAQVNEETSKGQLPWGHTNLIGAVYLNPAAAPAATAATAGTTPVAAAASPTAAEAELEFWRSVKDSNKPEELNAYLSTYPNGQFKSLAMARIASIESGAVNTATRNVAKGVDPATFTEEGTQVSEDQIGLDKTKRRDIQRRLTGLGFDTKMTGLFDDETRGVMKRWQAARGYPSTGFLTKLQHKALLAEPQPAPATAAVGDEAKPRRAKPAGNVAAGNPPPQGAPVYRNPPPQDNAGNAAGAAFIGGMMGGVLGGALRR
ncbi:peptidase [Bradyrhizobium sp. SSBR45G]|uniref:caspase family protein n=1 Tax=unclassified Bradyrhizobium TaxID=2631580 RepID=UPI002342A379|nr:MULTISPECIES: caspase family protein [unclassified Bradyrhizobium]GLH75644.1 peptidase [Bradyrhizobium sp. SSBR45G]GLH82566.1 peptidase [Bradyrhizobium sp. SSBR45R]